MTTEQRVQDLIGATAYDQDGQKVGNISTVYYDRDTGEPEWLTVKTGLFGMKENFVPLALARRAARKRSSSPPPRTPSPVRRRSTRTAS